ncbi:TraR/DksA family transcriptional regulator [Streptomyces sp. AA0539]|uniref:TraR/DksA family transcriptional regulator n=1 Tax=Streptomyces sp. AA0539 TaxID=1210045 RepID=UPI000303CFBF|nr:TraR/DksA C4-type zinc finger protein [Streptomyces sp. AA0539]
MVASDTAGDPPEGTPAGSGSGNGPGKTSTSETTQTTPEKSAKKTTAKKTAKKTTAKKTAEKSTTDGTGAKKVAAKNSTRDTVEDSSAAVPAARPASAGELPVRPGEDPWTPQEVAEARQGLTDDAQRLRAEIAASEDSLAGLMRDSGDGAGDDEADTGSKNITREHELALAANAREMLYQTEKALDRLAAGTYGTCEVCGKPIGKARMQAFPRATLCVEDKQRQERRL